MKFVVDAQLPRRLARELAMSGHDTVHTLNLAALESAFAKHDFVELSASAIAIHA